MKCEYCGAQENDLTGERKHSIDCPFVARPQEPVGRMLTQTESEAQPKPAPMRVMQFVGNVEMTPEGEPLRVTVLISGGLAGAYELGEDAELSIGDAVDLALTRAGRRLLSVDVR